MIRTLLATLWQVWAFRIAAIGIPAAWLIYSMLSMAHASLVATLGGN